MATRDCQTVSVEGVPDTSEVNVTVDNLQADTPNPGDVTATVTASNNITSGNGETITGNALIVVDGSQEDRLELNLAPGESVTADVEIPGVGGGDHEICIEV